MARKQKLPTCLTIQFGTGEEEPERSLPLDATEDELALAPTLEWSSLPKPGYLPAEGYANDPGYRFAVSGPFIVETDRDDPNGAVGIRLRQFLPWGNPMDLRDSELLYLVHFPPRTSLANRMRVAEILVHRWLTLK